jgi:hypothetical protein
MASLYRTFFSFGRLHWFWVCPLILLSPLGLVFKKDIPLPMYHAFIASLLFALIQVGLGGNTWCWGNRYLYIQFPFFLLPLAFIAPRGVWFRISFKVLAFIGLAISFFATIVNYHVVMERLVERYGWQEVMWAKSTHVASAPVWEHMRLLPHISLNAIKLISGKITPEWSIVRTECPDIWPVGITAMGIPPGISFLFWFFSIIIVALWWVYIVKPKIT